MIHALEDDLQALSAYLLHSRPDSRLDSRPKFDIVAACTRKVALLCGRTGGDSTGTLPYHWPPINFIKNQRKKNFKKARDR